MTNVIFSKQTCVHERTPNLSFVSFVFIIFKSFYYVYSAVARIDAWCFFYLMSMGLFQADMCGRLVWWFLDFWDTIGLHKPILFILLFYRQDSNVH